LEARSVFRKDAGFSGGCPRPAKVLVAVAVAVAFAVAGVVNDAPQSHESAKYRRFRLNNRQWRKFRIEFSHEEEDPMGHP
jgi:hypothetical protein